MISISALQNSGAETPVHTILYRLPTMPHLNYILKSNLHLQDVIQIGRILIWKKNYVFSLYTVSAQLHPDYISVEFRVLKTPTVQGKAING